jgi:hypothetical protein
VLCAFGMVHPPQNQAVGGRAPSLAGLPKRSNVREPPGGIPKAFQPAHSQAVRQAQEQDRAEPVASPAWRENAGALLTGSLSTRLPAA